MKRWHWSALGVGLLVMTAWASCQPNRHAPPSTVSLYTPEELCKRSSADGRMVRTYFRIRPTATADPRVWEYRPGYPPSRVSPDIRLHFAGPQAVAPRDITGLVSGWEYDHLFRASGVRGVLVLTDCHPAEPLPSGVVSPLP